MFGFFTPQCPVDSCAKQWIEERLEWLSQQFGRATFTARRIVLPTSEFFPDDVGSSEAGIRRLLDQVCYYMDVKASRVEVNLFENPPPLWLVNEDGYYLPSGKAGMCEFGDDRVVIHIERRGASDLMDLVATMSHELAHVRLMDEGRLTGEEFDNELLTDLTVVFHGLGIFIGNSPRDWASLAGTWPGTGARRPAYMTMPMFAYALAHAAWCRGDHRPAWARYLSYDLRPCFKQALSFLVRTDDTTFRRT